MLAVAVAKHLDATLASLVYSEDAGGNLFIATMPASPDVAVGIFPSPGFEQRTKASIDRPSLQVRVRGDADPVTGFDLAYDIYGALACLDGVTLDDGGADEVFVLGCTPAQSGPVSIGQDENRRHEWTVNFDLRTSAPTAHRPAFTST